MLHRLRNSLRFRRKWAKLGVIYGRSSRFSLREVTITGSRIRLSLPQKEELQLEHELGLIYFEDCYWLETPREEVGSILDIGGNVGLFSMIARHHFPNAEIHCYEPNPSVLSYLKSNLATLNVRIHAEAVGACAGTVEVEFGGSSLHTTTKASDAGLVPMSSFETALNRIGGTVDLLKLDCEGAEWEILEESEGIGQVNEIVAEFHLWARPGSSVEDFRNLVENRGFKVNELYRVGDNAWGLMRATRAS